MPDHPDREHLAAFQAGDGDRRQRAELQAHLVGCPSCAEVVATVEQARGRLALLEEPELPAGLHDRLTAALQVEAAQLPGDRPASRFGRAGTAAAAGRAGAGRRSAGSVDGSAPRLRPVPWYRRRAAAWGAVAALLLAALVAVPLLDRSSHLQTSAGRAGGGEAAQDLASGGGAGVPVLRVPGEVSAATVRSELAGDARARAALEGATARGGQAAAPRDAQGPVGATRPPEQAGQPFGSATTGSRTGSATSQPCLTAAAAAADPATRPLVPAFYVEGTYRGRPATVLVTTSGGQRGRVDLWVFARGSCSAPPLATERVR